MTRDEIITELFTGKNFNDCLRKIEPDYLREDLKQEVALIVCEWPEQKVIELHGRKELEFFVVRVILNQIKSKTSPFYRTYRIANQELTGREIQDTMEDGIARAAKEAAEDFILDDIQSISNGDPEWYPNTLLKLYMEVGNYRAIEKQTKIPYVSCYKSIQKYIGQLQEKAKPLFNKEERLFIQNS